MSRIVGPWSMWHIIDPKPDDENAAETHALIRRLVELAIEDYNQEAGRDPLDRSD